LNKIANNKEIEDSINKKERDLNKSFIIISKNGKQPTATQLKRKNLNLFQKIKKNDKIKLGKIIEQKRVSQYQDIKNQGVSQKRTSTPGKINITAIKIKKNQIKKNIILCGLANKSRNQNLLFLPTQIQNINADKSLAIPYNHENENKTKSFLEERRFSLAPDELKNNPFKEPLFTHCNIFKLTYNSNKESKNEAKFSSK